MSQAVSFWGSGGVKSSGRAAPEAPIGSEFLFLKCGFWGEGGVITSFGLTAAEASIGSKGGLLNRCEIGWRGGGVVKRVRG